MAIFMDHIYGSLRFWKEISTHSVQRSYFESVFLTPITDRFLGFNSVQNAYIYGITGGTATLVTA